MSAANVSLSSGDDRAQRSGPEPAEPDLTPVKEIHIVAVADVCARLTEEVARGWPPGAVCLERERHELGRCKTRGVSLDFTYKTIKAYM